jgi:hypothetical protein
MVNREELEEFMVILGYSAAGVLIALLCFTLPVPAVAQVTIGFMLCIVFGLLTIK